jgi:hypothetical protein
MGSPRRQQDLSTLSYLSCSQFTAAHGRHGTLAVLDWIAARESMVGRRPFRHCVGIGSYNTKAGDRLG